MNTISINVGPFALPSGMLLLLGAGLVAVVVGYLAGRRQQVRIGNTLTDMVLAGGLVARIVFVAQWFDLYRAAPWSMLDIRDGGFAPWPGVAAALVVALWRGWRRPALRRPLALGLAAGALAWGALATALRAPEAPALPTLALATLDGTSIELAAVAAGQPMVVNLWASWCPPCRREMPVLAAAQKQHADVRFAFVNQGEDAATANRYLDAGGLGLANVLLDRDGALARTVGSAGLPTTLFYDRDGRLADTHLGELSTASLAAKLARIQPSPPVSARK